MWLRLFDTVCEMKKVALVEGARTPFVKAGGALAAYSPLALSVALLKAFWQKSKARVELVDEIVWSTVLHDPSVPNIGREAVMRASIGPSLRAHTVSNNCISGLVAAAMISDGIKSGRIRSGFAGGVESMSRPALMFCPEAQKMFLQIFAARTLSEKLRALKQLRPNFFVPVAPSPKEPSTGMTMGEHCEVMAKEFQIDRAAQDQWAFFSHQKAAAAQAAGAFSDEIIPLGGATKDTIIRESTTVEKLATLKTVFDRTSAGTLTAGNSSALTDGASVVYLMEAQMAQEQRFEPLAYIDDFEFSAIDPRDGLLMAPALGLPALLRRNSLSIEDIGAFEIHEAFAAQVLCTLQVWQSGWSKYPEVDLMTEIPQAKINQQGGSIALGHPFAATGGRLLLSMARRMKEESVSRGVISVCAAGGMGALVLMSR